jgi:hypothetical protein
MRSAALGMGLAGAVAGCSAPPPASPVSVAEVIANIRNWDSKVVIIDGWLGPCAGYDCHIYNSKADWEAFVAAPQGSDQWMKAYDKGISIGFTESFDRSAAPLQQSRVRLKARINKDCWQGGCTDRADVLQPISIARAN